MICTQLCLAQSWSLVSFSGAKPAAREGAPGVYDAASNRMIVFGGRDSKGDNLNDGWVLTNTNGLGGASQWVNLVANGAAGAPAARSGHSTMYDAANNRLIIFGGCSANCAPVLNDVWVLTNANGLGGTPLWTQLQPTGGPPAGRTNAAAGYDAANNRVIVYSGQDGSADPCSTFSDIWVLSDANGLGGAAAWAPGSTIPFNSTLPGLNGAAAVFAGGQLQLFGGMMTINGTCTASNYSWEVYPWASYFEFFGGTLYGQQPTPRSFASLVQDTVNGRILLFGGKDASGNNLNDTWVLTTDWSQLSPANSPPPGHSSQAAVLDSASQRMIVFGGDVPTGVADTTWRLNVPGLSGMNCNATDGIASIMRAEGLTEKMGDLILICTAGTPTPAGQPIPEYTLTLTTNTDITSRRLETGSKLSEALAMIDEPFPSAPIPGPPLSAAPRPGTPLPMLCTPLGSTCAEDGTGGVPNPYLTQPNVFIGTQTSTNTLHWKLPIDPPGVGNTRIIRLTNLRANAFKLGVSSTLIPTEVEATVTLASALQNPQGSQTVVLGEVFPSAAPSIASTASIAQCGPDNAALLGGSGTAAFDFSLQVEEASPSSFMNRNYGTEISGIEFPASIVEQNVPGFEYPTETGFYSPSLFTTQPTLGLADSGVRILVSFGTVPAGAHLFVPTTITLTALVCTGFGDPTCVQSPTQGQLQLVKTDVNGHSAPGYVPIEPAKTIGTTPVAEATISGTSQYAVYEVLDANPSMLETATIPVAVAFKNTPAAATVDATMSLAPLGTAGTANATSPIPRFGNTATSYNAFSITSCGAQP